MDEKDEVVSDFALQYKRSEPYEKPFPFEGGRLYTYEEYYAWDDDRRWELIEGVPYLMSAPVIAHQSVLGELFVQLSIFLKGKPCKVFAAPFDVRLNADKEDNTVVQPDIVVICDHSKLEDKRCCTGTPDMVAEILSPSSQSHDRIKKLQVYEKAGIREYWILDPDEKSLVTYILKNGRYFVKAYEDTEKAPVHVLPGCVIDLADVFAE